ncbi:hypothetical protein AMS68_003621 [Peltaster fructicola]|uniref:Multiple RNA-binding domain-containing protein 1 n=1 Tax=Peltaster fructicola TaxID=286661 RepID=A0A6H0XTP3_9PEZI|nr:hypothetical protein AMS68_003621 [Peltaster fructicola]
METSSRIFVKGLPPSITESDFKKHFSQQGRDTTEVRLFANRRIGYVGYKSPEDAQNAVRYFNKTFVRMSRIGVELARPPSEGKAPTSRKTDVLPSVATTKPSVASRHEKTKPTSNDPKLKEFLEVMKPNQKKRAWESEFPAEEEILKPTDVVTATEEDENSEYEDIPRKAKRQKSDTLPTENNTDTKAAVPEETQERQEQQEEVPNHTQYAGVTDEDWARSRTSRLLGLLDDDEKDDQDVTPTLDAAESISEDETQPQLREEAETQDQPQSQGEPARPTDVEAVRSSMRLFLRNLAYDVKDADLEAEFESFGSIEEVHVSVSKKTGTGKGFAYIQFSDPDAAEAAFTGKDGQIFQGRILHILPAAAKREDKLNDFELSKLPLKKQQQIQRRRTAANTQFNWNTLYMNPDAVVSSVAAQLGIAKSDVLDPTSSDAAVKQAHAETHIIQETKSFFKGHGVDLDAFKRSQRGDTAILVKNIPFDASRDELKRMFEEHGQIRSLAYKRIKSSMLFLEKAPKDIFMATTVDTTSEEAKSGKVSTTDLKNATDSDLVVRDVPGTATLFVRNLNFDTTTSQFTETFSPLTGFLTARVKTKTDPKKPGQILSMGFGFVEFRSAAEAQAALSTMDGYALHGHKLQVRASNKGADAAEERRKADQAKREAGHRTKVIIKNLPFEASKKDVRALFGAYGQLRSIRVPKKMDRAARGFAFADFTTPKEAQSAMDALKDTHLLGRRLVLDFAEAEPADAEAEIAKMAAKVGSQANAVAVQKLTGQGRKKFTTAQEDDADS